MSNTTITLKLADATFQVELFADKAPIAVQAFLADVAKSGSVVHSMWSGPLCLFGGVNLNDAPLENPAAFLVRGDIAYHPEHREIGIPYNTTQWREPVGSVYVSRIGRIVGDLDQLARIGGSMQRTGAQPIAFS